MKRGPKSLQHSHSNLVGRGGAWLDMGGEEGRRRNTQSERKDEGKGRKTKKITCTECRMLQKCQFLCVYLFSECNEHKIRQGIDLSKECSS